MEYEKITFLRGRENKVLDSWFGFFSMLGSYFYKESRLKSDKLHIAITIPGTTIVPIVTATGLSDEIFRKRFLSEAHVNRILSLEIGQMVYYFKNGKRIVCAFDGISEQHPFFKEDRSADLKSKDLIYKVAERHWPQIQVATEQHAYKIKKSVKGFGISSKLLKKIYGEELLLKAVAEYSTEYYIVGNNVKLTDMANAERLEVEGVKGALSELLCIRSQNRHEYYHSEIITGTGKLSKGLSLVEDIPIIFTDAASYINRINLVTNNSSLIFLDRTDRHERNEEVIIDIKRRVTQGKIKIITEEVLEDLKQKGYSPPFGIEIMAWSEKS